MRAYREADGALGELSVDADVRAKADPRDWTQIGASMPCKVVQLLVRSGDTVNQGSQLLITEAMKMETALTAPRDAVVEELLVRQGEKVEAGDLLVRLGSIPHTEEGRVEGWRGALRVRGVLRTLSRRCLDRLP